MSNRVTHRLFVSVITAALAILAPAAASAGNPCQSEWTKFKDFFDANGPKIAKGVCGIIKKGNPADAQACVETFEKAQKKVEETLERYNAMTDDSAAKVGPRGLGENTWASGTLLAERTFAAAPIMSDSYRIELQRTGGKAKNGMTGTICFLDSDGNLARDATEFTVDPANPNYAGDFSPASLV